MNNKYFRIRHRIMKDGPLDWAKKKAVGAFQKGAALLGQRQLYKKELNLVTLTGNNFYNGNGINNVGAYDLHLKSIKNMVSMLERLCTVMKKFDCEPMALRTRRSDAPSFLKMLGSNIKQRFKTGVERVKLRAKLIKYWQKTRRILTSLWDQGFGGVQRVSSALAITREYLRVLVEKQKDFHKLHRAAFTI